MLMDDAGGNVPLGEMVSPSHSDCGEHALLPPASVLLLSFWRSAAWEVVTGADPREELLLLSAALAIHHRSIIEAQRRLRDGGLPERERLDAALLVERRVMVKRLGDAGKRTISLPAAPDLLVRELDEFQNFLLARASTYRDENTSPVDEWDAFAEAVRCGWALALHCGRPSCEADIKAETAATPRCIPSAADADSGPCVRCAAPSAYGKRVIFGRSY
jgi:hypothetical protein